MPEALSPAAYNASLEGPLGRVWVASDGDRITQVSFAPLTARCTTIPGVLTEALRQLEAYMRNGQTRFDLPIRLEGTPFHQAGCSATSSSPGAWVDGPSHAR
jgi:methylated-DNA-[protein]-cysteine S-methyltransferase